MNLRNCCVPLLLAALAGTARAQVPPPPLPGRGAAPLLFLRFLGPPGMRATFYQGRPVGRSFDAPAVVGMRPGYSYRVQLSGLKQVPGGSLYPTVQVFGSLQLTPRLNAAAYPAPVLLTEADISSVLAGSLVTKVVYLENPDLAVPMMTVPEQPLETVLPPGRDPVAEARDLGRTLVLIRFGERTVPPAELARESVPGTILFPGEKSVPPASRPPCLPCTNQPLYDPLLGPRPPEEECLHDGGDRGLRAGLDAEGRLRGVDPEDTVAEFTDSRGGRHVTHSNRVCLCVPRFAILRTELPLGGYHAVVGLTGNGTVRGQQLLSLRLPSLEAGAFRQPLAVAGRVRSSVNVGAEGVAQLVRVEVLQAHEVVLGPLALVGISQTRPLTAVERLVLRRHVEFARELSLVEGVRENELVIGTAAVARFEGGPQVITAEVETRDLTVCCHEAPCPPDKPLVLVKCADRQAAQIGDVVTFTLRYSNHGGRPITDVAVTDSLAGRLEYVPGSAQSDRDAVFTLQQNAAGSLILRWEVSGRLLPGQSGTLRFQARVR